MWKGLQLTIRYAVVLIAAISALVKPLGAQVRSSNSVFEARFSSPSAVATDTSGVTGLERARVRAMSAVPWWAGSSLVGGIAGAYLLPVTGDDGRGRGFVIGSMVGGILASATTAGIIDMGDGCGVADRFLKSLIGSGLGTVTALTLTYADPWFALTIPVGTVGGAVFGASRCEPPPPFR